MKPIVILGLVALAGTFGPQRHAAAAEPVPESQPPMLKDVHLKWETQHLVLYAAFNQSGHDLSVYLEWRVFGEDAAWTHRIEIDYIEQYAQGMPIAITVASLEKNPAGQSVLYMGQPLSNTPKIERADSLHVSGRIVIDGLQDEHYAFVILPRTSTDQEPQ